MGEIMTISDKNKILILLLSIMGIIACFFGLIFVNSQNKVDAAYNEWHYVTIKANLSNGTSVAFKYDSNLFSDNINDARSGSSWYIVSRDINNQVLSAKKYVQVGSNYGIFPQIADGYDEVNWKIYNTDTVVTSSTGFYSATDQTLMLTASYHQYKINYKNCENATNSNPTYHTIQKDVTISSVSKQGYVFKGWTTDYQLNPVANYVIPKENRADVTLIANWEANQYQVKFNANGGSGTMPNQDFEFGKEDTLDEVWFVNGLKNFVGWATSSTSKAIYCDMAKVVNLTSINNGVFELFAVWTDQNVYQVKFNANGGAGFMNNQPFAYQDEQSLNDNLFSKTGFTFAGWNTKLDGSGTSYQNAVSVNNLTTTPNDVVNLYAVWQENTYKINFDANGGEGEMSSQEFRYTELKKLSKNLFYNQDLEFACWNTQSNGKGDAYSNEQLVSRLSESGEITLYAIWQTKTSRGLSSNAIIIIAFASVVVVAVVVTTILVRKKIN